MYCSLYVHENQMTLGISNSVIGISNNDAVRTLHLISLPLFNEDRSRIIYWSKNALSARSSVPPLCFAGSFFTLNHGSVLIGMHAADFLQVPPSGPCCYQTLMHVWQSGRHSREMGRIITPIHAPHQKDKKPCTDWSWTSPSWLPSLLISLLIALILGICEAKSRAGSLIPVNPKCLVCAHT